MKKILLITDVPFWYKGAGHATRIAKLAEFLSEKLDLTILFLATEKKYFYPDKKKYNILVFQADKVSLYFSLKRQYVRQLRSLLKVSSYDFYLFEYLHLSYLLKCLPKKSRSILDTHDIISDRTLEFKRFGYKPFQNLTTKKEIIILCQYEIVLFISNADYAKMRGLIYPAKSLFCSHAVEIHQTRINEKVQTIGFVASNYLPNVDAIMFFINNCWTEITKKHNVQLKIYGYIQGMLNVDNIPNISLIGFVEDTNEIYKEIDIVINPIRFGAGIKIKNIEALSYGKPLVTTSHGAIGLEVASPNTFVIADSPREFISAISQLIQHRSLRFELQKNAYAFITDNFSEAHCYGPLLKELLCKD